MINLNLYRTFHNVARFGNISLAAEELYVSQPAVSKAIKNLEKTFDLNLFTRTPTGMKLTSEGKLLYEHIDKAMGNIREAEVLISQVKLKERGVIRLGVSATLCKYFLMPKLKSFMEQYPNIEINIINRTTFETIDLLENDVIDFGIISVTPKVRPDNYYHLNYLHDIFVANDALSNAVDCTEDNISIDAPLMLLEKGNITRQFVDDFLRENNVSFKSEVEVSNMDFLIDFAKMGLGVSAVIKEFVADDIKNQVLFELPLMTSPQRREMGIIVKKKELLSVASNALIDFISSEQTSEI